MRYILNAFPSAVTITGMAFSLSAIFVALSGALAFSLGLLLLAFVCDLLDGAIARRFGSESDFGRILDSIADVPLYLLYPCGVVVFLFGTAPLVLAILVTFVFCGVWRLVRFTREGFHTDKGRLEYSGIPVFATIPVVCVLTLWPGAVSMLPLWFSLGALAVLSPLMVSRIRVRKPDGTSSVIIAATATCCSLILLIWH